MASIHKMMKKYLTPILIGLIFTALFGINLVSGAPTYTIQRTILPEASSTYDIGTSTRTWKGGYFDNLYSGGYSVATSSGTTGILSLNGSTSSTQTFATSSDTNIGLVIGTTNGVHTFTPTWIGTLADSRIASASTWNAKITTSSLSSTATGLSYDNNLGVFSWTAGYEGLQTASSTQWNTAYDDRFKWDGGSTGLTAATGRVSLGLGDLATANSVAFASTTDIQASITATGILKGYGAGSVSNATSGIDYQAPILATTPLVFSANNMSMPTSTSGQSGFLSSTDWTTFNNKQATISFPLAVASSSLTAGRSLTLSTNDILADAETYDASSGFTWFNATSTGVAGKGRRLIPRAMTITKISCWDTGTSTINFIERAPNALTSGGTAVLTSELTCGTVGSASSTTFANAGIAAGNYLVVVATTTGNDTEMSVGYEATYDD